MVTSYGGSKLNIKYPRTPYWPHSPTIGRGERVHADPSRFTGVPVVVTEKLDGSNVLLHEGNVYGRSMSVPSEGKWMAMVKKHHAWKVTDSDIYLYGEDIYGVHSIEYGPVPEDQTFYAFALRDKTGAFSSFTELECFAEIHRIPVVPVLFRGTFGSVAEISAFFEYAHAESSVLGNEREGVVLRLASGFMESEFPVTVCKSVRAGHVQSDEHWTKNWSPCKLASGSSEA